MRDDDKRLSTNESALAKNFLLLSFFTELTWYSGVFPTGKVGSSDFVTVDDVIGG